ncbi:MAG TPA: UDP-N-acetylmuramate dehydrogenase [Chloroflexi bacterium]|nr:UDP-N-acetylmuramate dehydrogenase [Chloroflexota bacterium]
MLFMDTTVKNQLSEIQCEALLATFGERLQRSVSLGRFTAARIGGAADWLIAVESTDKLAETVTQLWGLEIPFRVLGSGSNVLVSDAGVREVVLLNKAQQIRFDLESSPPSAWAESGANFGLLARQAASRGLSGLEWAAGVPGTVGGAVYGNAGAHGSDVAATLQAAEILLRSTDGIQRQHWPAEHFEFSYRASQIKRVRQDAVILSAQFRFQLGNPEAIKAQMDEYNAYRRRTQPPGASMGSIFKNPPGDYAGRLIEAAGLKGTCLGGAEISLVHANFFVNSEGATASDVIQLIQLAQRTVAEKFGVELELEIELIGDDV